MSRVELSSVRISNKTIEQEVHGKSTTKTLYTSKLCLPLLIFWHGVHCAVKIVCNITFYGQVCSSWGQLFSWTFYCCWTVVTWLGHLWHLDQHPKMTEFGRFIFVEQQASEVLLMGNNGKGWHRHKLQAYKVWAGICKICGAVRVGSCAQPVWFKGVHVCVFVKRAGFTAWTPTLRFQISLARKCNV